MVRSEPPKMSSRRPVVQRSRSIAPEKKYPRRKGYSKLLSATTITPVGDLPECFTATDGPPTSGRIVASRLYLDT